MQHMDQRLREAERLIDAVISSTDVACVSAGELRVLAERIDRISRKASGFGAVVVGGVGAIAITLLWARLFPELKRARTFDPPDMLETEPQHGVAQP